MEATSLALDRLLCSVGDPVAELSGIGPTHPEFNRAQTIRAGTGVLAKTPNALPAIAKAIRPADAREPSPRMRAHFAAGEAWLSGNPLLAAESYAAILTSWPRDLLALRLAMSCYFFLGWHDRLRAIVDVAATAWTRGEGGFQHALGMASFVHAESGDASHAEALGREALALDPSCPSGVHAVAHAFAESGRHRDGVRWMREQRSHWAGASRMRTHNAWHLAMFEVEEGNLPSAVEILDDWLLPASERSTLDACDATALLWRLAAEGVDDEARWSRLSDAFARNIVPGFWPFVDLHAGLAHWTAGKQERARQLAQAIDRCADGDNYAALRARHITRPWLQAIGAMAEHRRREAAALFARLQPLLGGAGGSGIQLELFRNLGHALPEPAAEPSAKSRDVALLTVSAAATH